MSGKKFVLYVMVSSLLLACSNRKESQNREYEDRVLTAIDARDYVRAIQIIESEMPDELEGTSTFQVYLAQAHLGAGGLDTVDLVGRVRGDVSAAGNPQQKILLSSCNKGALSGAEHVDTPCWMARLFIFLPAHNDPHLLIAEQIFREQLGSPGGLSMNNKILLATLKTTRMLKHFGSMLEEYLASGDDLSRSRAQAIFAELTQIAADYHDWFQTLNVVPSIIHEKLTGNSKAQLLGNFDSQLKFVEETGVPHILETLPEDNQAIEAKLTRVFLIQGIDFVIRDFFKVPE